VRISSFVGLLSIDASTGRVVMDIGSAFNNKDVFLGSAIPYEDSETSLLKNVFFVDPSVDDGGDIHKHLEISSYDEYDDFAPRHPLPKEKGKRLRHSITCVIVKNVAYSRH
jgi:hypothetical protein